MGVPLIGAIYENDPRVGLYTLPLLIFYPLQLVVGAFLVPRLKNFLAEEKKRLGITDDDDSFAEYDDIKGKSRSNQSPKKQESDVTVDTKDSNLSVGLKTKGVISAENWLSNEMLKQEYMTEKQGSHNRNDSRLDPECQEPTEVC